MENQTIDELKNLLTPSATDELKTALNEATKDELINLTLALHKILRVVNDHIGGQQETINDCQNMIKTMVHMNNDKVTVDINNFNEATAPGMDIETTINKINDTMTLTLTKRSVQ